MVQRKLCLKENIFKYSRILHDKVLNEHDFKKHFNLKDVILIMFVTGDFIVTPTKYVYYLSILI